MFVRCKELPNKYTTKFSSMQFIRLPKRIHAIKYALNGIQKIKPRDLHITKHK